VDILKLIAPRLSVPLEFKADSFSRCMAMLKKGQVDLMAGLDMTLAREAWLDYVMPPYVTSESKAFYALQHRAETIVGYEYLHEQTIGVVRGVSYFAQFDVDDELRKSPRNSMQENLERLLKGGVSVVIADEAGADWWLATHPEAARHIAKAPLKYQDYHPMYFAFSKKSPRVGLAGDFGAILAELIQDGTISAILSRHAIRP